MQTLRSFICGRFVDGGEAAQILVNPATEAPTAELRSGGYANAEALAYARERGGPALRAMSFAQRGELLRALGKAIHGARDQLIELAIANGGNTRSDAKFDIDGASGTLAAYAELGKSLGDTHVLSDGDPIQLTRSVRFFGRHLAVPREGVAVHVNAFNFPAWNMMEKAATALLAGMPVLTKPATATALVAHRIVELVVEQKLLPDGSFQLVMGSVGDLLEQLVGHDCLAFTGSSDTGIKLRGHARVVAASVRVNLETDSLNAAVLGPDLERGTPAYDLFIGDVVRDMTQKTGQKCTAIRRIFVHEDRLESAREDLLERLALIKIGDPSLEAVTMGPVATRAQHEEVRRGIARLASEGRALTGGDGSAFADGMPLGVPRGKGFFVAPTLFEVTDAARASVVHGHEVFGPVATLVPYTAPADALAALRRGDGSLVSSVYSDDRAFLREMALGMAAHHGRLFLGSSKLEGHAVGPGTVLPQLVHGGPGRAGGGEELGGLRGLAFYMQRTAIAGDRPILDALFGAPEPKPKPEPKDDKAPKA
jgi:oxepin-CoA hydrolase/3-oxo-5,6-dehydrosuberyl-CoA semialdehyde dehydrogenase